MPSAVQNSLISSLHVKTKPPPSPVLGSQAVLRLPCCGSTGEDQQCFNTSVLSDITSFLKSKKGRNLKISNMLMGSYGICSSTIRLGWLSSFSCVLLPLVQVQPELHALRRQVCTEKMWCNGNITETCPSFHSEPLWILLKSTGSAQEWLEITILDLANSICSIYWKVKKGCGCTGPSPDYKSPRNCTVFFALGCEGNMHVFTTNFQMINTVNTFFKLILAIWLLFCLQWLKKLCKPFTQ